MSRGKHTPGTMPKRSAMNTTEQMHEEKAAMKKARAKFPHDPQKAKVEADLILLARCCQLGKSFGR